MCSSVPSTIFKDTRYPSIRWMVVLDCQSPTVLKDIKTFLSTHKSTAYASSTHLCSTLVAYFVSFHKPNHTPTRIERCYVNKSGAIIRLTYSPSQSANPTNKHQHRLKDSSPQDWFFIWWKIPMFSTGHRLNVFMTVLCEDRTFYSAASEVALGLRKK